MKHVSVKLSVSHKWWVKPLFLASIICRIGRMSTLKFIGRYGLNVRVT